MSPSHPPGSAGCREVFARLSEYIDGELEADLCAGLEGHMDDCPPCQAFLASLRRTIDLTRDLPDRTLPDDLKEELLQAYRKMRRAGKS